ncbi:MAG TPA: redoxin domain-containing protein [Pyrinomonadaceae bacterium]|jgi:thiol-disulfide isomerase/thioredoxin|nr:redoxin domain-containing protein [Pyrinomonadaceae bacterium]
MKSLGLIIRTAIFAMAVSLFLVNSSWAQSASETAPVANSKITQIDVLGLKHLLKPNGKPLLINFWATWCDPCREEYPDLVKLDQEYRGKIDFLTISLDDLEDKDTAVPKFLTEMKAEMPAYLLVAKDEEAAMAVVSRDWSGGLPFTILYDAKGGVAYSRQGKVKLELLKTALVKIVAPTPPAAPSVRK